MLRLLRTLADEHFVFRDRNHRYHLVELFELSNAGWSSGSSSIALGA